MALTIEDGTVVPDANSFISVAEARSYAADRGLSLPAADGDVEPLIVRAADYLESLNYKGQVIEATQALSWPRENACVNGEELDNAAIPNKLKQAQSQLTFEAQTSPLLPTGDGKEIIKEVVDVIETEFATKGSRVSTPVFKTVDALLKDLVKSNTALSNAFQSVRI